VSDIGNRIRELRKQRGMSQRDVQQATHIVQAHVSRVELGRATPSLEVVERFATLFGVPLHEMFRRNRRAKAIVELDGEDGPLMRVLAGYVRRMSPADRALLLQAATLLSRASKQTPQFPPTKR
jgi:putative transcriptional regulator